MPKRSAKFMAARDGSLRKARAAKAFPLPEPRSLDPLPLNTEPVIRRGREAVTYHIPTSPFPPDTAHHDQPTLKTTIALPRHSTWTSGLHFHTQHTEYLRLLRGCIFVYLDGEVKILSAKAGGDVGVYGIRRVKEGLEVEVPRYARHNWGRAKEYLQANRSVGRRPRREQETEDLNEEVVVEEWTDPADLGKPLFFWNLNGVITAPSTHISARQNLGRMVLGNWWIPFQLFVIFWDLDNWPVFLNMRNALEYRWPLCFRLRYRMPDWPICVGSRLEHWLEYLMTLVVLGAAKLLGLVLGVRAVEKKRMPVDLWEAYSQVPEEVEYKSPSTQKLSLLTLRR
jgi:hypothetical protein